MWINLRVLKFHRNGMISHILMGVWILSVNFVYEIHPWLVPLTCSFFSVAVFCFVNEPQGIYSSCCGWELGPFLAEGSVQAACWERPSPRVLERCAWATRGTAVLKMRSGGTPGFPGSPRGVLNVKTIFIKVLRCYLLFTFILSWVYTGDPEVTWHAMLSCPDG